jgi:hypothetical protein
MDFPEILYEYFFQKSVQEIQFSLDSVKKKRVLYMKLCVHV